MLAAVASVVAVNAEDEAEERRVVAAGRAADGVELPAAVDRFGLPVTPVAHDDGAGDDEPPRTTTTKPAVVAIAAPTTVTTPTPPPPRPPARR